MKSGEHSEFHGQELDRCNSRRRFVALFGNVLLTVFAELSGTDSPGGGTDAQTGSPLQPTESAFVAVEFSSPTPLIILPKDHDGRRLNLSSPDEGTFKQAAVAEVQHSCKQGRITLLDGGEENA